MRYTSLPNTELTASVICLGTAFIGSRISKVDSFALLDAYRESGGNFLDMAHVYADWLGGEKSVSEKTIGRYLSERNCRGQVILATKGGHPDLANGGGPRLASEELCSDLDASLACLGTDYIDIYWLHRDDLRRDVGEIIETLNEQFEAGKIRYYGCSNWTPSRIEKAQQYAYQHGLRGFIANQLMWSLAHAVPDAIAGNDMVMMNKESMEFHLSTRLPVVAYSSQAQGFFTKLQRSPENLSTSIRKLYYTSKNIECFKKVAQLAQELSVSVNEITLSYLLSQPFASFAIVGCRTRAQLVESVKAADLILPSEQIQYLCQAYNCCK